MNETERWDAMPGMYADGMSIRQIAEATGLGYGTVRLHLKERLGELRRRGGFSVPDEERTRRLLARAVAGEILGPGDCHALRRALDANTLAHAVVIGLRRGLVTLDPEPESVETALIDLSGVSLAGLRSVPVPEEQVEAVRRTAARARRNIGSSGPPGRCD